MTRTTGASTNCRRYWRSQASRSIWTRISEMVVKKEKK